MTNQIENFGSLKRSKYRSFWIESLCSKECSMDEKVNEGMKIPYSSTIRNLMHIIVWHIAYFVGVISCSLSDLRK